MKKKYIYISLLMLQALALASCSTADNSSENDGNTTVGKLTMKASLSGNDSRVAVAESETNGLTTTWEAAEDICVYHKFLKNGTALSTFTPLTFVNTSTAGSSGVFQYDGIGNYKFNTTSGNDKLYSFNVLPTAANYTQTANSNGTFTLTLNNFNQQNGTLSNLYEWDAMYGSATATGTTTAGSTTMKHLCSAVCIKLTNAAFSGTLSSVVFSCPNDTLSILPSSSATFTLGSDGTTVTPGTLTGATSWTVNNVPVVNNTATVYLMTFPFSNINSGLQATVTYNGTTYYFAINLSNLTLNMAHEKIFTLNEVVVPETLSQSFYMWDAPADSPYVFGVENNNPINTGEASQSCAGCPSYDQIRMYLGAGVYFDNTQAWSSTAGSNMVKWGGLWIKRSENIAGWNTNTGTMSSSATILNGELTVGRPTDITEYFFLPTLGAKDGSDVVMEGEEGCYWSRTPTSIASRDYLLNIGYSEASVKIHDGRVGFCPWSVR